jgi:hypothetical protein
MFVAVASSSSSSSVASAIAPVHGFVLSLQPLQPLGEDEVEKEGEREEKAAVASSDAARSWGTGRTRSSCCFRAKAAEPGLQ